MLLLSTAHALVDESTSLLFLPCTGPGRALLLTLKFYARYECEVRRAAERSSLGLTLISELELTDPLDLSVMSISPSISRLSVNVPNFGVYRGAMKLMKMIWGGEKEEVGAPIEATSQHWCSDQSALVL